MAVLRFVRRVGDGDDGAAGGAADLMVARRRVRQALALPADEYDDMAATALLER